MAFIIITNLRSLCLANQIAVSLLSLVKLMIMGIWKQIGEYLYIKKRDPNDERTKWMKYMHGMNRISLIMFLIAVMIIIFKLVILPFLK